MRSRTPGSAWSRSQRRRLHDVGVGVVDDQPRRVVRHRRESAPFCRLISARTGRLQTTERVPPFGHLRPAGHGASAMSGRHSVAPCSTWGSTSMSGRGSGSAWRSCSPSSSSSSSAARSSSCRGRCRRSSPPSSLSTTCRSRSSGRCSCSAGRSCSSCSYRWAQRFVRENDLPTPGVGADRLVGLTGIVTDGHRTRRHRPQGRVRGRGRGVGRAGRRRRRHPAGQRVTVLAMKGTRVVVEPLVIAERTTERGAVSVIVHHRRHRVAIVGIAVLVGGGQDRAAVPARARRTARQVQDDEGSRAST